MPANTWQDLIDYKLLEWGRNPDQFDDENVEPPTRSTILLAIALAQALSDLGVPPADSVVPDPNGGIVFDRREGEAYEVFHIWEDGTVEYHRFLGTSLVERRTICIDFLRE